MLTSYGWKKVYEKLHFIPYIRKIAGEKTFSVATFYDLIILYRIFKREENIEGMEKCIEEMISKGETFSHFKRIFYISERREYREIALLEMNIRKKELKDFSVLFSLVLEKERAGILKEMLDFSTSGMYEQLNKWNMIRNMLTRHDKQGKYSEHLEYAKEMQMKTLKGIASKNSKEGEASLNRKIDAFLSKDLFS